MLLTKFERKRPCRGSGGTCLGHGPSFCWVSSGVGLRPGQRLRPHALRLRRLHGLLPLPQGGEGQLLRLVRPGGLILVDNVLWSGNVVNQEANDENTLAIRAFNDAIATDDRVESVMLAISDGLSFLRVR